MKNLNKRQMKLNMTPVIIHNVGTSGPTNSSAARWNESSATPDCFATIIRDRILQVQYEESSPIDVKTETGDVLAV